jgi:hypothetical protein
MKTLAELLYPDESAGRLELEEKLRNHPAFQSVKTWPGVVALIAKDILAYLDMPIGSLAVSAYQKHERMEKAKRETAQPPGSRQVVQLMEHKITNKLEPRIEMEVKGVTQTLLGLELATELSVESATAIVESGRLVDIAPGSAKASVTLSAAGVELAKAESQPVDLALAKEAKIVIDLIALGEPSVHQGPIAG